jgi:hypothetical protein
MSRDRKHRVVGRFSGSASQRLPKLDVIGSIPIARSNFSSTVGGLTIGGFRGRR